MDAQMLWFLSPLIILSPFSRRLSKDQFVIALLEVQGGTEHKTIGVA